MTLYQKLKETIITYKKNSQELVELEKEAQELEKHIEECQAKLHFLKTALACEKRKWSLALLGEALHTSNFGKPATQAWSFKALVAAKRKGKTLIEIALGIAN